MAPILLLLESYVPPPFSCPCINIFSGRWEESLTRDKDGNIFLDYDDELIKIIVNYLREKKIEDPSDPVTCPIIPRDKTKSFQRLIQYFGLAEFLYRQVSIVSFFREKIILCSTMANLWLR